MCLSPRESGQYIIKYAKYVKALPEGIKKLKEEIIKGITTKTIDFTNYSQVEHHPKPTDTHAVEWIFLIDTLNFCFWTPKNYTKYKINGHTGYFALCAAVNRALKEGIDITNANFYATIDEDTLSHVFRPDDCGTKIPLIQERINCLHQVGTKLIQKYDGKFINCVTKCENSAENLLKIIVKEFPCFRDEAEYEGMRVSFYKRAQILIGDLWACFQGEGPGKFIDLEKITMFADYRVPQSLVHFGSLEYNPELLDVLQNDILLKNGDRMEVEIRGASIHIVEEVKKAVLDELDRNYPHISKSSVNSILIDHFLWDYRRRFAKDLENIPFHKVLSIYY